MLQPQTETPTARHPILTRNAVRLHLLVIVGFMAFCGLIAYSRGQDTNYDQLNYHYYSAYAFMTGRLTRDVAPSQIMHNYFSPFPYLPFYFMVRHLPPRVVGTLLGALHGLNLWLVFVIARIVSRPLPAPARPTVIVASVIVSAAGPMVISELGTSMSDWLLSIPVLAGLALAMGADRQPAARFGLAGALTGAATSLKLTCAPFALGLAAVSLIGWTRWRQRLVAFLATGVGGGCGFVLIGGYWYWLMWRMFGNPLFPYFNNIFRSPDFSSAKPLFDAHYVPHSLLAAVHLPFLWIGLQKTTTEVPFRDIRFALLIVLAAVAFGCVAWRRGAVPRTAPAGRRLIAFMAVAFCLWMYEWSIQRYLLTLELLTGPAFIVLLDWTGFFRHVRGRALAASAAALAIVCAATVRPPDWGHLGWRKSWFDVSGPPLTEAHPLYILDGEPLSYVVPELQPASPVIGIVAWEPVADWGNTVFLRRIHALIADPQNSPVWSISVGPMTDSFKTTIARYGLKPDGACDTRRGRPLPLTWCPLARVQPVPVKPAP